MRGTQLLHVPSAIVIHHSGPDNAQLELGLSFSRGEEVGEADLAGQETLLYHAGEVDVHSTADVAGVVGEDGTTVDDEVLLVSMEVSS